MKILSLGNGVILEMLYIPCGSFLMGTEIGEEGGQQDALPQHTVTIKSFFMSKYPITQAQWKAVAQLPQITRNLPVDRFYFQGDNLPADRVSWYDAEEFCQRLSLQTWRKYRLPSEAEWEYACRGNKVSREPFTFGRYLTSSLANFAEFYNRTTEVGKFSPNAFGLYDMHGNVWEWCADHEHNDYQGAPSDGSAWIEEGNHEYRVLRGGSWGYSMICCRSDFRYSEMSTITDKHIGFRVVLEA